MPTLIFGDLVEGDRFKLVPTAGPPWIKALPDKVGRNAVLDGGTQVRIVVSPNDVVMIPDDPRAVPKAASQGKRTPNLTLSPNNKT